ncbi:MAG: hypothetical protein AAF236_17645 [Verrucomicrobiota bacterium]
MKSALTILALAIALPASGQVLQRSALLPLLQSQDTHINGLCADATTLFGNSRLTQMFHGPLGQMTAMVQSSRVAVSNPHTCLSTIEPTLLQISTLQQHLCGLVSGVEGGRGFWQIHGDTQCLHHKLDCIAQNQTQLISFAQQLRHPAGYVPGTTHALPHQNTYPGAVSGPAIVSAGPSGPTIVVTPQYGGPRVAQPYHHPPVSVAPSQPVTIVPHLYGSNAPLTIDGKPQGAIIPHATTHVQPNIHPYANSPYAQPTAPPVYQSAPPAVAIPQTAVPGAFGYPALPQTHLQSQQGQAPITHQEIEAIQRHNAIQTQSLQRQIVNQLLNRAFSR